MNRIIHLSLLGLLSCTAQASETPLNLATPEPAAATLAADPCQPKVDLKDDDPTNDGLLEAFPADICQGSQESAQVARQWATLQKSLLARSPDPVQMARLIEQDRQTLQHCQGKGCRIATLKQQVANYVSLWEKLPDPAGPAGARLESWSYSPNKVVKRLRPLLRDLERACFGKPVRYKDLRLSATHENVVLASCATANQVAPLWLVSVAGEQPSVLFASDTGSACYRMPASSGGYPDLGCPVRLSASMIRTTLFRYDGKRYQAALLLDKARSEQGEVTLRYTLK
ncbi:hypothetical protein [Pseudomonas sp. LRF_L74]|uniref:hypothetical protein n=1 Tax=Pseudomonas sp. LRF_L74 TaxID=3369422 RepID=UPI003F601A4E